MKPMPVQRLIHAIPLAFLPAKYLTFKRATVIPGVTLQKYVGPLARETERLSKLMPVQRGFTPTHLLVINQNEYFAALDERLHAEGQKRPRWEPEIVELDGVVKQVLVAVSLTGHTIWTVGGHHTFDRSDVGFPYSCAGYSHRPTEKVSDVLTYGNPSGWLTEITPAMLRQKCAALDPYYRCGTWWVDRLSVALGYLWSAYTTKQPALAFASLCMALEAIATSAQNEITHTLAERCALLARSELTDRMQVYSDTRELYNLRSKVVHGRSAPRRGMLNQASLSISAKMNSFPRNDLARMLALTIDVINGVVRSSELMRILQTRQSDDRTEKAINEYFLRRLLS
jgi:Apea-like HEPN